MPKLLYGLNCDACGAEYELQFDEDAVNQEDPIYCPFCGSDVDPDEIESEELEDSQYYDFREEDFEEQ